VLEPKNGAPTPYSPVRLFCFRRSYPWRFGGINFSDGFEPVWLLPIIQHTISTRETVKIFARGEFFEATATVLYSGQTLGMGLGFREVKPVFQDVLRKWLRQALDASNAAVLPTHDGKSETDS